MTSEKRKEMYFEETNKLIKELGYIEKSNIIPCTIDEINYIQEKFRIKFPTAFVEFLALCGHQLGIVFHDDNSYYKDLISMRRSAKKMFKRDRVKITNDIIILTFHEGYLFNFIKAYEDENPPVYSYTEGSKKINKIFDSFTSFVNSCILDYYKFAQSLSVSGWKLEKLLCPPVPINIVKHLHFNCCEFKTLPSKTFDYINLTSIDAWSCNLEEISDDITKLINLNTIRLNNNNFIIFPNTLLKLEKLNRIDISNNKIKSINMNEKDIKNSNIEYIDLSHNNLEYISDNILGLRNLRELNLFGNKKLKSDEIINVIKKYENTRNKELKILLGNNLENYQEILVSKKY